MRNGVRCIKEQNIIMSFYLKTILYMIVTSSVLFTTYSVIFSDGNSANIYVEPLSSNQQRMIIRQIGGAGFKETLKNGCYNAIAVKMQTGMWSSSWCHDKYKHLKLE